MSPSIPASFGVAAEAGAFVTGCVFSRDGRRVAFSTGDGVLHISIVDRQIESWSRVPAHDGSIISLAQGTLSSDFLTGGDDHRLLRIVCSDEDEVAVREISRGRRWVEHVASFRDPKGGLIASAHGREVELRDATGTLQKTFTHGSTVSGIAFDAKGKRLGVSHYNGVSLRFTNAKNDTPRLLSWKGSHIGIAIHPSLEAVVTAMQENELHGWRLADDHHMRMSGYPQKPRSIAFSRSGRWLASTGADAVVLWPFFGGGPMGKPPLELAGIPGVTCTKVAFHPQHEFVAAGFADGSILLAEVGNGKITRLNDAGKSAISAMTFAEDGAMLAFGTEGGTMRVSRIAAFK